MVPRADILPLCLVKRTITRLKLPENVYRVLRNITEQRLVQYLENIGPAMELSD